MAKKYTQADWQKAMDNGDTETAAKIILQYSLDNPPTPDEIEWAKQLYIEEKGMSETTNKQIILFRQAEVQYNTVSPFTGEKQCANCRWFSTYQSPSFCAIIEPYPDEIMATGHCNQWALRPSAIESDLFNEFMGDALEDKSIYLTPKPLQDGLKDRLLKRNHSKTIITHASDGLRYGLHITSNGYEDRDLEHVAVKALEQYVESCYKETDDGIEYVGTNPLLFWHDDRLPIGDIIFVHMQKGFLMEVSKERNTPIARKLWDFWENTANDGIHQWGTSHGFKPVKMEVMDDKKVYQEIDKKETSVLLWEFAANQLTISEVINDEKNKS